MSAKEIAFVRESDFHGEKIYLVLSDTGTVLTKMIKLYTGTPYNHASIAFDKELVELYSFGRKQPRNPFIGGFVKENTSSPIFSGATCAIYSCEVTQEQLKNMKNYIGLIEREKQKYKYNFIGLFAIMLNIQFSRDYAFCCSQFVGRVLSECDSIQFPKPLTLLTPNDLRLDPYFQLEYEGCINSYLNSRSSLSVSIVQNEVVVEM